MTTIAAVSVSPAPRPPSAAEATTANAPAGYGTGAHEVWDNASSMADQTRDIIEGVVSDFERVESAKRILANLDEIRAKATE